MCGWMRPAHPEDVAVMSSDLRSLVLSDTTFTDNTPDVTGVTDGIFLIGLLPTRIKGIDILFLRENVRISGDSERGARCVDRDSVIDKAPAGILRLPRGFHCNIKSRVELALANSRGWFD
jgi:hypothetical protein